MGRRSFTRGPAAPRQRQDDKTEAVKHLALVARRWLKDRASTADLDEAIGLWDDANAKRAAPAPSIPASPGAGGGDRTGARPLRCPCGGGSLVPVPTCPACNEQWIDGSTPAALDAATDPAVIAARRARRTAPRPEAGVPHHAADGTLRHYCTRDHCPDFTEGSMVRIQEPAPRPKPCADCDEPDDSHHPLCVQAPPSVEGLPEETLAELERLLAALPGAPWRYEEQERGASSIEPNVMWFTDRGFAHAGRAIVALRNAFPALARRQNPVEGDDE